MLVLTRKPHQTIQIGDRIRISIVGVKGRAVRIGIEAPEEIRVVRGELVNRADGSEPSADDMPDAPRCSVGERSCRSKPSTPGPLAREVKRSTFRVNRILAARRKSGEQARSRLAVCALT